MSFFEVETQNAILDVEDENGEKMGLAIELRPMSDPAVQRVKQANKREFLAALRKGKDTAAMQEDQGARLLASAIVSWEWSDDPHVTTPEGKVIAIKPKEYSEENALAMMQDADFAFVSRQVDDFLGKASNFYKT